MMMYSQETTTEQENDDTTCPHCTSSLSPVLQRNPKRERPPIIPPLYPSSSCGYTNKLPLPLSPPPTMTTIPPLRRCSSDPVPFMMSHVQSADVATPEKDMTGRTLSRSVSAPEKDLIDESPNSKRLKRMKEQMREISKWCDQVITEGDEEGEDDGREDHLVGAEVVNNEAPKGDENKVCENAEETVSVEKDGDCLIIHMKCPCSKAYRFLLSGNNCYYKIM